MSETDIMNKQLFLDQFTSFLSNIPLRCHFRVHRMFNINQVQPYWHIEKFRKIDDLHLLFVKGGKGTYYVGDKEESLFRGKVILVSNQFPYAALPDPADLPGIIPVRFGLYENASLSSAELFRKPFYYACVPGQTALYQSKFEQLYRYYDNHSLPGSELACSSVLHEILLDLLQEWSRQREVDCDERIVAAKELIDKSGDRQLSVEGLASSAGMSSKHFTRLFAGCYGMTPKQYMLNKLMRDAAFLLEETTMKVSEIAERLGYPDPFSFSKQFKKLTGSSPMETRRWRE